MSFWKVPAEYRPFTALIDSTSGRQMTYGDLDDAVEGMVRSAFRREKQLLFLYCSNQTHDIVAYMAALRAGHTVLLLESKLDANLRQKLIVAYEPDLLVGASSVEAVPEGYAPCQTEFGLVVQVKQRPTERSTLFPDLAVLLSTSGTTGSPKLVRLTYSNVSANAAAIADYLSITRDDRAITSLPMSYSYGLSVINSHLARGASLVCTSETMAQREFWDIFNRYVCTSFAGVPYNYQMLMRFGFKSMSLPSMRSMTQAGGRLERVTKKYFANYASEKDIRFYVMYGQTEASPRISYVPPQRVGEKLDSIGIAIPGGQLSLQRDGEEISGAHIEGELIYKGPNVMLGYAESRLCLSKGNELLGVLKTGDIAYRDEDGYYYITGRLKRFLKVFGLRLNLDEIEKGLEGAFCGDFACTGTDDKLVILIEQARETMAESMRQSVVETYKVHGSAVKTRIIPKIPRTSAGKKDYAKIKSMVLE